MIEQHSGAGSWQEHFEMRADALAIIGSIISHGPEKLVVIADWDGVLTDKDPDGINGTTWGILRDNMPSADAQREHRRLYNHYQPLEASGTLTTHQAERWQRNALRLLNGASLTAIRTAAEEQIVLRQGVRKAATVCRENGIPFIIKSTGSKEIIEAVSDRESLDVTHIFANSFVTGPDGDTISGVRRGTLTHSLNKDRFSHRGHLELAERTSAIVIGDNLHDVHMVRDPAVTDVFRIRLDGGRNYHVDTHGQPAWDRYVTDSFGGNFNAVAIDNDTLALVALVHEISARHDLTVY